MTGSVLHAIVAALSNTGKKRMIEKINVNQAIADVKACLFEFQNQICHMLQTAEPKLECVEDEWQYEQGGGGCSRAFVGASIIEKAGANFSHVHGAALPPAATAKRPELVDCKFQALGVSTVTHPYNPFVPTSHANVRFFVAEKPNADPIWWFGGGFDLTPFYGFAEDAALWHQHAQAACAPFGAEVYSKYKEWCDNYFYLPHRQEPRGVGGLFFDDLNEWGFAQCFAFMQSVAKHYLLAYQEILTKRHATPYTEQHRDFQCYRRGRYVEFNLLYDRGTLFGIQSNGRTESILMSLPPLVKWKYNWVPESGSEEEKLYREFLIRKEWV